MRLLPLVCALLALTACGAPAQRGVSASPAPAATAAPAPTLALTVVQTVRNGWTGRQTESVFTENVVHGESYTVKNMSGVWSLTFTLTQNADETVTVTTARPMLPRNDGDADDATESDTFVMALNEPFRIDEPVLDYIVWYTFTFFDPLAPTPEPADDSLVQFHDRHILSNIRRTLHEGGKSAFTKAELELILFVELKGDEVKDISELQYLPNIDTLTLRDTRVTDLSPLSGCESLHTLVLLENEALDLATLPALPALSTLSITGNYTKEDILFLKTLLPNCGIVAETEN